jgi:hypothetical protein
VHEALARPGAEARAPEPAAAVADGERARLTLVPVPPLQPMRLILPPERLLVPLAVVVGVAAAEAVAVALQQRMPCVRLPKQHWQQRFKQPRPLGIYGRPRAPDTP